VVSPQQADELLSVWQALPDGAAAAVIGQIDRQLDRVSLITELGGERMLEELEDDPLPRIC
jgi:hydrogenase expression/formation protein HypE